MNTEYVWWLLAVLLAGGAAVAFLAVGRVPEIEDEPSADDQAQLGDRQPTGHGLDADPTGPGADPTEQGAQSAPVRTTVPGPGAAAASTSDTP